MIVTTIITIIIIIIYFKSDNTAHKKTIDRGQTGIHRICSIYNNRPCSVYMHYVGYILAKMHQ